MGMVFVERVSFSWRSLPFGGALVTTIVLAAAGLVLLVAGALQHASSMDG
jgi:hypothetical protein